MVQVREAVQKAQRYLPDVFPTAKGTEMRLEGVELSDDAKFWIVTFSYVPTGSVAAVIANIREYKTVKLRAVDGKFYGARNGLSSSGLM